MLTIGIEGEKSIQVTLTNTARALGSGELEVFATPAMISLMEATAQNSIKPLLDEGLGTVGTLINIRHISATPVGVTVHCKSKLVEIDNKRLVFWVAAYDGAGLIGEGTHERFIVNNIKFFEKACKKKEAEKHD
ncbi:MAG: thioesterase family protein [Anaerolineae bacterium]|nr:thioesterase family protein [Anaerolineae bacterium]